MRRSSGRELADVVLDVRGDDRVVVVDLGVVDDPGERKRVELQHELRSRRVLGDVDERRRGRLQLRDEVAGEPAGARARIRDRLLALVQGLGGRERAAGGEAEAPVRIALERGQVVEERRPLRLLLALDVLDGAGLAGDLRDDLLGALRLLEPGLLTGGRVLVVRPDRIEPEPLVARVEARVDEPVRLGDEGLDLALAGDDDRERRGLDAAQRDDAADPRAAADGRGAGRVHADEPVGLGARSGGRLERLQLHLRDGAARSRRGSPTSSSS